jgi:hypothetical protein
MARYPASYPQTIRLEAPTLPSTVSCRLSATGIRFSVILFPPRDWALLTVGLPTPATEWDLDGVTAFRTHERRPGWVPSIPRGRRCSSPGRTASPPGVCRATTARPYHPAPTSHRARLCFTRHQRRFKRFTRPIFPSPAAARMERAAASAFPRASHPAGQEPDNARRGGDRPTEHGPETRSTSSTEPPMSCVYSMCATSRRTADSRASTTRCRMAQMPTHGQAPRPV